MNSTLKEGLKVGVIVAIVVGIFVALASESGKREYAERARCNKVCAPHTSYPGRDNSCICDMTKERR